MVITPTRCWSWKAMALSNGWIYTTRKAANGLPPAVFYAGMAKVV